MIPNWPEQTKVFINGGGKLQIDEVIAKKLITYTLVAADFCTISPMMPPLIEKTTANFGHVSSCFQATTEWRSSFFTRQLWGRAVLATFAPEKDG